MTQLSLPLARRDDPQTSHDAAARVPEFRSSHEAKIIAALRGFDGLTYREIADLSGLEPVAVARRLLAMSRRGLIERRGIDPDFESEDGMVLWWLT